MARIRTIKHEFFLDEGLAKLSPHARLCFIGLWTLADRAGRLEDRPERIKATLFPYETKLAVADLLDALAEASFIVRYRAGGKALIQVRSFARHQRPNVREPDSEFLPPEQAESASSASTADTHVRDDAEHVQELPRRTERARRNGDLGMDHGKGMEIRTPASAESESIRLVFDAYRKHHPKAFLTPQPNSKEWNKIRDRLREGSTVEDLTAAIDGYHRSPFHLGANETKTRYLDLELIVRDGSHVTKGLDLMRQPSVVRRSGEVW